MGDLSDRQRKFAENLATGMSQTEAYKRAGYTAKNNKVAEASASRLLSNAKVSTYLDELRAKSVDETIWTRNKMIAYLCAVLEIDVKDVINPETGAMELETAGSMVTSFKVQEKVNANGDVWGVDKDAKFFSKEKAAEMLTKLMGWNEPEKLEVDAGPSLLEWIRERNGQE